MSHKCCLELQINSIGTTDLWVKIEDFNYSYSISNCFLLSHTLNLVKQDAILYFILIVKCNCLMFLWLNIIIKLVLLSIINNYYYIHCKRTSESLLSGQSQHLSLWVRHRSNIRESKRPARELRRAFCLKHRFTDISASHRLASNPIHLYRDGWFNRGNRGVWRKPPTFDKQTRICHNWVGFKPRCWEAPIL